MAWERIMPTRMNTSNRTLSGTWTVPAGITDVHARLVDMSDADRSNPAKNIRITIREDGTNILVVQVDWWGKVYPPGTIAKDEVTDLSGTPIPAPDCGFRHKDLPGKVLYFEVEQNSNTRYGAEVELR